jgi:hypothetical protein
MKLVIEVVSNLPTAQYESQKYQRQQANVTMIQCSQVSWINGTRLGAGPPDGDVASSQGGSDIYVLIAKWG